MDATTLESLAIERIDTLLAPLVEACKKRLESPAQEMLSLSEASALTGLSKKHLSRAMSGGELPYANLGGSEKRATIRVLRKDVFAWFEGKKVSHAPPRSERDARVEHHFRKRTPKTI